MGLIVLDGAAASQTLKTTIESSEHIPHHIVDRTVSVSGADPTTAPVRVSGDMYYDGGLVTSVHPLPVTGHIGITGSLPAGTNNIGDVDVITLPDITQATHDNLNANANLQIGDTDVSITNPVAVTGSVGIQGSLPAGTNNIGDVDVLTMPEVNVNLQDGAGTDLTSTLVGADQALDVNIVQTVGGGGGGSGQQYAHDAAHPNPTGTVMLGYDGVQTRPINIDSLGDVQVDVKALPAMPPITGEVTIVGTIPPITGEVTIAGSLPAGTNNIGDVDILSMPDVTQATHDNFNANVNLQISDTDVSITNPVAVTGSVGIQGSLPAGTNNIGDVDIISMPDVAQATHDNLNANANLQISDVDVSITNPVAVTGEVAIRGSLPAGTNNIGDVDVLSMPEVNVNLQDGAGTDLTSTLVGGDQALDVNIVATVGSIGGGHQYAHNAAHPNPTGTVILGYDGVQTRPINIDSAGDIQADVKTLPAMPPITGEVTIVGTIPPITGEVTIAGSLPAGTNNIGDVDILTMPDVTQATHDNLNANANIQVGNTDVATNNPVPVTGEIAIRDALPAGNNNIGNVDIVTLPDVTQATHDNLNANANLQISDTDVSITNPVAVTGEVAIRDSLPAGTNNIGDVDVLTLPDVTQSTHDNLNANANLQIGDTDVSITNPVAVTGSLGIQGSLPAGTNNIGDVDILTLPDVTQATHDNLNLNANIQVGDVDVSTSNYLPISGIIKPTVELATNYMNVRITDGAAFLEEGKLFGDGEAHPNPTGLLMMGFDGSNIRGVTVDSAGDLQVDIKGALPAGTNNIGDVDIVTLPTLNAAGDVAHDGVDSGNPIKIGGKISSAYGATDDLPDADRTDAIFTRMGALTVMPYAIPEEFVHGTGTLTGTANHNMIPSPGSNFTNYITSVGGSNTDPAVSVRVDLKDGTDIKLSFYCAASGGGFSHQMPTPLKLTANTAFQAACSATVADVRVNAQGFTLAH